jgi:hypothetical protein
MKIERLTKLELNELVGGFFYDNSRLQQLEEDIINHNTVQFCKCTYKNTNAISNNNDVKTCICSCI